MKTKTFLVLAGSALMLQFAPAALGAPDSNRPGRHGRHARLMANLSTDERAKLRVAHQKAMADPSVQAAKDRQRQATREFREQRKAAMLRADPSIQPILDKMPAGRGRDS